MGKIHITEENLVRSTVAQMNRANALGFNDAKVAAITNGNVAGLVSDLNGLATAHETEKNYLRQTGNAIQKMADLKTDGNVAVATNPALTDVGTTGLLLPNKIYDYTITSIDYNGNESAGSAETTRTTANDGNSTHKVTFAAMAAVVGAESYRVYRKLSTDAVYAGYLPATKAALEGGTFADTGAALTGTAAPPTTSAGKIGVLTNAEVAAAKVTGTFASLLGKVTADSQEAGSLYGTDIMFGDQVIS